MSKIIKSENRVCQLNSFNKNTRKLNLTIESMVKKFKSIDCDYRKKYVKQNKIKLKKSFIKLQAINFWKNKNKIG